MQVRLATMADYPAVMALYDEASDAMTGTPHDCCWRRGGHPSRAFVEGLVRDGGMLVALADRAVVGAVGIDHDLGHDYGRLPWLVDAADEEVAVVHLLVVRPDHRGRGLSRRLLRACLDEAHGRGMRSARLDATANNAPAIALYESEGFTRIGGGWVDVGVAGRPVAEFVVMERPLGTAWHSSR